MLIEFKFRNYRSFKDWQTLSLVASSDTSLIDNIINTEISTNQKLLSSAVIYGANASGKSNIIKAIDFVENFVRSSAQRKPGSGINVKPFLLNKNSTKDVSEFEIDFIHKNLRYQFGFAVDNKRVHKEWLIAYPNKLPQEWYRRTLNKETGDYIWKWGSKLTGEKEKLKDLTRSDVLFLSVASQFNHKKLSEVYYWFNSRLCILEAEAASVMGGMIAREANENLAFRRELNTLLQSADFGIVDFEVIESEAEPTCPDDMPEELQEALDKLRKFSEWKSLEISMKHVGDENENVSLKFTDESLGTQRLFGLGGYIFKVLEQGNVLVVDELDASFHPLLVRVLIELFHNPKVNRKGAQLIFNTHDVTLFDRELFRRDQMWLVEKNREGVSYLYSLQEFSPRKTEALADNYLKGRYGGIPFIDKSLIEATFNG